MGARRAAAGLAAAFFVSGWVTAARAAAPSEAVQKAGKYLVDHQTDAGAWGTTPAIGDVADGVVALVSAEVASGPIAKAVDYVATHGAAEADRTMEVARVILAAIAADKNPRNFGRVDYVGRLKGYYNPNNGNYDTTTDPNSLAILAVVAANEPLPEKAVTGLQARACPDGGFPRATCVLGTDVAVTALALNAMAAAGVGPSDPVYAAARSFLAGAANSEGGFGTAKGGATEALATSRVLNALKAIGDDPDAAPWRKSPTADPRTALAALQDGSGGFKADRATAAPDDLTTARVLPAFAGFALPVRPASKETTPTLTPTTVSPAGGGAVTTTSRPATRPTVAPRRDDEQPGVSTPTPAADPQVGLASPANRRDTDNGRSLLAVLPFVATLFGAGAVGVVLRRRART